MTNTPRTVELPKGDPRYPLRLMDLADPPEVLYCMGDLSLLKPAVAIVGARRATPYGLACARRFAGWAARAGVCVASGAAAGCDSAAHTGAIEAGGRTIAVLGCGADVDYPETAGVLLQALRENHLVVSEVAWGVQPTRFAFPRRNRIIAALSAAVLVVEAGLPSGTFSTADAALDLGRAVLAVPGSIHSPESRGSNRLIRQGASPVTDVSELASELHSAGLLPQDVVPKCSQRSPASVLERMLAADPMRPDDIARATDSDIVAVLRALGELELAGRVVRYRDGRYGCAFNG